MGDALSLMWRDATEWPVLTLFLMLPTALSIVPISRGSKLALLPPLILSGQCAMSFLYYATDWWSNPGMGGAMKFAVVPTLVGLALAMVAALSSLRSAPTRAAGRTEHEFSLWDAPTT
jgi:hypothetical protein